MNDPFERNAAVLRSRWPALLARVLGEDTGALVRNARRVEGRSFTFSVRGVQLTSRHDRPKEARLQAASFPANSREVHLYGCGLGDVQRVLLAIPGIERLSVHVLNGALLSLTLQWFDQSDWLADPRVRLAYAGELADMQQPFFGLPAEMVLADDFNARMRDRLLRETHLAFNNRRFDALNPEVQARLRDNTALLRRDRDVAELFNTQAGREVYVIATGPTLERNLLRLKQLRDQPDRPLFICVDTAYRPLLAAGIEPDLVMSIDALIDSRHLPADESAATTLVYLPMVQRAVLESWRGPRYAAYSASPVYRELRRTLPRASLNVSGSVIHPAVDLAVRMGARTVTLFGADFAFPLSKTHAGWKDGVLGPELEKAMHWVSDGHGRRIKTQLNLLGYLCELERYIVRNPQVAFFNSSRSGALISGAAFHPDFAEPERVDPASDEPIFGESDCVEPDSWPRRD